MLIDRLRATQSDAIAIVNQMVGKVINFLHQVGELGQTCLDQDMENATLIAAKL